MDSNGNILFNQGVSAESIALDELSDVALSGEAEGEFLRLNGSAQWVNVEIVEADISDLQAYLLNISGEDFTDLADTPANYVGAGSRFVKVNSGASALEFVADPGFLPDITDENIGDLADVTITAIASNEILTWNASSFIDTTLAEATLSAVVHTHRDAATTAL